jgi:hypothetical protein
MRDDFNEDVKRTLAARVGNRCSNPDCRALTSGPQDDPIKALNVGVAAHISAASPAGPRYDVALIPKQRCHADNGIWLCQTCAKLVDNDVSQFPADLLREWKRIAENDARLAIGKTVSLGGRVLHVTERVPLTPRAHLHISGFHFVAPGSPGGRAETKVIFVNNGSLTAEVVSLGRMAFYVGDSDHRTRRKFEDSLFADRRPVIPRGHPNSFILAYGTDRSISIVSSPWDDTAIDAFLKGRADMYVAGRLVYSDQHNSYETMYCSYMKISGQQFFSNKYNDEP